MKCCSLIFSLLTVVVLSACAHGPIRKYPPLEANEQYGQIGGGDPQRDTDVVVMPQWHLSSSTTTTSSSAGLPQSENQRAIYRQLVEWVEAGQIKSVIVEGCEGEIQRGFADRFNGWDLDNLVKLSSEDLDNVMTQVGLKLKARFGMKTRVLCGDSYDLVKKHQLILSDMRGLLGFKIRIEQFTGDIAKRADYVATVRDLLKMPPDSDEIAVMAHLDQELRSKLTEFNTVLHERNSHFVKVAAAAEPMSAIVIGAIHVSDLNEQLKSAHLVSQTYQPVGLKGDESEVLGQIRELLARSLKTPPSPVKLDARPGVLTPPPK